MNTEDYINKVTDMLSDTNVYTKVDDTDNITVKNQVLTLLISLRDNDYITDKQYRHLTSYNVKTPVFYGMPKIHKPNNPLRPIVSQINGPTYKINQYIHVCS